MQGNGSPGPSSKSSFRLRDLVGSHWKQRTLLFWVFLLWWFWTKFFQNFRPDSSPKAPDLVYEHVVKSIVALSGRESVTRHVQFTARIRWLSVRRPMGSEGLVIQWLSLFDAIVYQGHSAYDDPCTMDVLHLVIIFPRPQKKPHPKLPSAKGKVGIATTQFSAWWWTGSTEGRDPGRRRMCDQKKFFHIRVVEKVDNVLISCLMGGNECELICQPIIEFLDLASGQYQPLNLTSRSSTPFVGKVLWWYRIYLEACVTFRKVIPRRWNCTGSLPPAIAVTPFILRGIHRHTLYPLFQLATLWYIPVRNSDALLLLMPAHPRDKFDFRYNTFTTDPTFICNQAEIFPEIFVGTSLRIKFSQDDASL